MAAAARTRAGRRSTDNQGTLMEVDITWLTVGFIRQALFSARFFVQWLKSEKLRKSVMPAAFWYFSVAGGATLLAYAIHRRDPVYC
jgi:lipid-A-disaccharide synthase-like uncharacterized protein